MRAAAASLVLALAAGGACSNPAPAPSATAPPASAGSPASAPASPAPAVPAPGAATAAAAAPPLEKRPPHGEGQAPAFPGQTRAPAVTSATAFQVDVVARGLVNPWAVEPLPDGTFLVTEKPGRMRIVSAAGEVGEPITGVLAVDSRGQGGLLDVALSPAFATDRTVFWSFTEPRDGGNATSVAKGVLSPDGKALQHVRVILRTQPTYDGRLHYGSRVVPGPDGMLYVTLGDRSDLATRPQAQDLRSHLGKTLRVTTEGGAPPDNPFVGHDTALPETWTVGQRNVQAAAFDASGRLWTVDHGAQGGDELNLLEKGANYGWPLVTFGEEYSGSPIPNAVTTKEGFRDPVYYWDPVIAPSGAEFCSGKAFPEWRGNLFVGALREMRLVRLVFDEAGARVVGEEHLLTDRSQRIRDVREGPDGFLYVVTDESRGELWRIRPRG